MKNRTFLPGGAPGARFRPGLDPVPSPRGLAPTGRAFPHGPAQNVKRDTAERSPAAIVDNSATARLD